MAPVSGYGSITTKEEVEEEEAQVELLPSHHHQGAATNNGNGNASSSSAGSNKGKVGKRGGSGASKKKKKSLWLTRHHCVSYTLAALICLISARYWQNRSDDGYSSLDDHHDSNNGDDDDDRAGRVPTTPALSNLDPHVDLGFRSATRDGLASPSKAWGEKYSNSNNDDDDDGDGGFVARPLPTNEWYLNLLSHVASDNPSAAGEIARVYAVPYIVDVSLPRLPSLPSSSEEQSQEKKKSSSTTTAMAGIQLSLPVMKTSAKNMQMVFDRNNGLALGASVSEKEDSEEGGGRSRSSSPTSYEVDPDVPLSPLGVSLRWNDVALRSSIVRGMPYGTVRYGADDIDDDGGARRRKSALPTIVSGNRPVSILIDSHDDPNNNNNNTMDSLRRGRKGASEPSDGKMMCGSLTGEPAKQNPYAQSAPISSDGKAESYAVEREVVFHMDQSDFTWVAFFSRPVKVRCFSDAMPLVSVPGPINEVQFRMDVVELAEGPLREGEELVVRVALLDECTTGRGVIREHCDRLKGLGYESVSGKGRAEDYLATLREGAALYPRSPLVGTEFPQEEDEDDDEEDGDVGRVTNVVFDWDATAVDVARPASTAGLRAGTDASAGAKSPMEENKNDDDDDSFIMFALPHHLETLDDPANESLCLPTFHGRTCLVRGSTWNLPVEHGAPQSFLADRPPAADAIGSIAEAVEDDLKFEISPNVLRGAADTYFPGKILAKMGRVVEIDEELRTLQFGGQDAAYPDADDATIQEAASAAAEVDLPSEEDLGPLLDDLQRAVEVWLIPGGKEAGGAEAEFIYDATWGGFINCGCRYTFEKQHESNGTCSNVFPDCPALDSVNENFGNGWYNDHHFHYGYHIYAAAIVAKHRPEWGREYYDRVLLYVRDIANPSADDEHFPVFRQKDFYLGNSWAAGLMSMELSPHGREQESSSEAIAAFEGIALYGQVMMDLFADDDEKLGSARLVRNLGEFLTATEVSAANRYWHVWGSKSDEDGSTLLASSTQGASQHKAHVNTYPKSYPKHVVGMLYDTMASFQTWFAPQDVVSYGIQLIPLTAVAQRRDDPEWSSVLYPVYAESCKDANEGSDGFCEDNGWSIVQAGLLAETGEMEEALEMAKEIPEQVFNSDGGCGNSLSNTLWFISTRNQPPSRTERYA